MTQPHAAPKTSQLSLLFLSCKRLPYLRRTVQAVRQHFSEVEPDVQPHYICFDNGSSAQDRQQLLEMGFDVLLLAKENRGIGPAMNALVSMVRTPYFLNLQDDWEMRNPKALPLVRFAIGLLEQDQRFGHLKVEDYHFLDFSDRSVYDGPHEGPSGIPYFVQNPNMLWGGFSFPPAVTRTSVLHMLGPFREDQPFRRGWAESEFSQRYTQSYLAMKCPELMLFHHIGDETCPDWDAVPASAMVAAP
jgi:hypothetical protein